ncbi:serine/threonine-protein kinase PknB [Gordonia spumicola]|uniref:non-specific serine/threonine protein kinase n=1 Tax=Gordonia spumicola TaxID=589161 RepID=A0A7I9V657_9ACTN|nr:Stk1 family PASTA domain-containing Ser/Thr kinase [Gordonia spumicola]GEE00573.1 serine/threonine-protein kinase PknB [Gordonia spumicola]
MSDLDPHYLSERYELGETLGFGGMSEVQYARDLLLHRDVAIKVLRADLARDPSFYLRFRREAQNAAKLTHPSIVQVFDTGEAQTPEGPLPFIVMEYVDGDTLRDILRASESGVIAPKQAMTWMADVAAAMDFSHRAAIVHRDMKPANVMIDRAGAVKVMDFGIARAMDDTSATMTQTSAVMGTAQYLSPEQARGIKVDPRSDIYSMGCVLFELTTGEPPFTGDSPIAVAHQHVHEDPRRPSAVRPELSPELDSIVMQAMSKNPANRYQTAADFRSDLIKVLAGGKPSAPMLLTDEEQTDYINAPRLAARDEAPSRRNGRRLSEVIDDEPVPLHRRRRLQVAVALIAILALVGGLIAWAPWTPDQPSIAVPKVTGLSADAAKANLEQAGFTVKEQDEASTDIAEGLATRTVPGNDVPTPKGSEVTLYVSSGPQKTPIPDLRGKTLEDARNELRVQGFTNVKVEKIDSTAALKDKVVRTNPQTGATVAVTSDVTVFIGTGPKVVTVPDLRGQTEKQATATLEGMGLDVVSVQADSELPAGQVVNTSPGVGESVRVGSTVQLMVSRGNMFVVPDLRGMTPDEAQAALVQAGWGDTTLNSNDRKVPLGSSNDGKVVSQRPAPGDTLKKSDSVSIVVGRASIF